MLSNGPLGERLAVLRDVLEDPSRPLKLGPFEGEDFIDLLMRLAPATGGVLRQMTTMCLMSYQDPRTLVFMLDTFRQSRDAAIVLRLGQRILMEQSVDFFRPYLWEGGSAQALASAQILAVEPDLTVAERLRVGLLLPGNAPVPPVTDESLSAWVGELTGPLRAQARRRAEGPSALLLWPAWDRLGVPEQNWLLYLTRRLDPERARVEVEKLLVRGFLTPGVVDVAHSFGLALPLSLLSHDDPAMRARGVSVGLADSDLRRYLDATMVEALAAARRCPSAVLVELLSDPRWQVRALAVRLLGGGEAFALDRIRALVRSSSKGERVAAIELLRSWGEEAWLEQTLL